MGPGHLGVDDDCRRYDLSYGIGPNSPQLTVPQRWGYPFWEVVADFADQGLSRFQVARAIGYTEKHFCKLLANNPEHDPFEPYGVVANYIRDTGEGFRDALTRMSAAGYSLSAAAREIGFSSYQPLQYAMRVRGIEITFQKYKAKPKLSTKRRESLTAPRKPMEGTHPWRAQAQREVERHAARH